MQGSGLLQHGGCLEEACHVLAEKAEKENVLYLEVRCSPINYTQGGLSKNQVHDIISRAFEAHQDRLHCSLIYIASRHGEMATVEKHVELAETVLDTDFQSQYHGHDHGHGHGHGTPLRGFDLAGNEQARSAANMLTLLMPMMERCLHFTIHAGETQDVKSIWEAVYILNAERIGHGLTLKDNPNLMERFRDRNIVLEMCPSSNVQIVGYRDNYIPETFNKPEYPLKEYLGRGLKVTVNTDNPGISRTGFSKELHRACRLTPGGLNLWEILSLVKNSFKASFAERSLKQKLLKDAEAMVVKELHALLAKK